jgi:hypothetical protein
MGQHPIADRPTFSGHLHGFLVFLLDGQVLVVQILQLLELGSHQSYGLLENPTFIGSMSSSFCVH